MASLTAPADTLEALRYCEVTREHRRALAQQLAQLYETGARTGPRAVYNKLRSHVQRLCSYLFAPDTVRFAVHLPMHERARWIEAASVARDEFRHRWTETGADLAITALIEQSLVWGTAIAKVQADVDYGFRIGYIAPWDFGVGREDVPSLEEQDVIAHWYVLSVAQAERWLRGMPGEQQLLREIRRMARSGGQSRIATSGLLVAGVSGAFPSGVVQAAVDADTARLPLDQYPSEAQEPVVELVDVWERVWAEGHEDWVVRTLIAHSDTMLLERINPDLPWMVVAKNRTLSAELPFVAFRPRPRPDSFWGRSELTDLEPLQGWLDEHLSELRRAIAKQLDPPKFLIGIADPEEAQRALDSPGGTASSPEPAARMDRLVPEVGEPVFATLAHILRAFDDISGIPELVAEGVAPGIRAGGQFLAQASVGAGRIRRMALAVEEPIGQVATLAFRLLQRHDSTAYRTAQGQEFLLSQLPDGIQLRVRAHSSSPIFAEQGLLRAMLLQRAGALRLPDFVELVDPPNRDELVERARQLEAERAAAAREWMDIARLRAERGLGPQRGRRPGPPS